MSVSAVALRGPYIAAAPSLLNTLLENAPVYSEARLNKPVDCVLLGVSGAW